MKSQVTPEEVRPSGSSYQDSSAETIKEMGSLTETGTADSSSGGQTIVEGFVPINDNDTSTGDLRFKKFSTRSSWKYLHEHTTLGPRLATMTCPNCLMAIQTAVRYVETSQTHLVAVCLFPLGLCLFPYCTPYFRNAEHYCPMCDVYLGTCFAKGINGMECCRDKSTNE